VTEWFAGTLNRQVQSRLRDGAEDLEEFGFYPDGIKSLLDSVGKGDEEAATLCFGLLALLSWKRRTKSK
jgi:hypothetical protein